MSETNDAYRTGSAGADVEVLLVDDDEAWASSTAEILARQREGFAVRVATDLTAAANMLADDEVDCIVCDYDLYSGTGLDLLADVRERGDDRPFILITGQGNESVASDAIGRQVTDYIPKRSLGGRDDLLARRIKAAVESYRTEQALARERRSKEAMLDILTATSSREGVVREFCDHLVSERGYACAWIGTGGRSGNGSGAGSNGRASGVVPRAAAGEERYVDAAIEPGTPPDAGAEPALVALDRRELHVVSSLDGDASAAWERRAAGHGFRSAAAIPITHDGATFGVLAVYGTEPGIDARERDLLAEYAETIGYALRSAEWKESLLSATPVALEIEVTDAAAPLVALDRQLPADAAAEILTTVVREDSLLYVLRVEGATATAFLDGAAAVEAVEHVTVTRDEEPLRCELAVALPTPETVLAAHGGRVVDATVEQGRATITAVTPDEDDVQSLIEAVRSVYPDAGVRSVRSSEATTPATTADALLESLTDKQRRAVEMAYFNGYFERPREHNTTEIAEKLGVSRQTLTQHLRAGERKLFGGLFDPEEP